MSETFKGIESNQNMRNAVEKAQKNCEAMRQEVETRRTGEIEQAQATALTLIRSQILEMTHQYQVLSREVKVGINPTTTRTKQDLDGDCHEMLKFQELTQKFDPARVESQVEQLRQQKAADIQNFADVITQLRDQESQGLLTNYYLNETYDPKAETGQKSQRWLPLTEEEYTPGVHILPLDMLIDTEELLWKYRRDPSIIPTGKARRIKAALSSELSVLQSIPSPTESGSTHA